MEGRCAANGGTTPSGADVRANYRSRGETRPRLSATTVSFLAESFSETLGCQDSGKRKKCKLRLFQGVAVRRPHHPLQAGRSKNRIVFPAPHHFFLPAQSGEHDGRKVLLNVPVSKFWWGDDSEIFVLSYLWLKSKSSVANVPLRKWFNCAADVIGLQQHPVWKSN